MQDGAVEIGKHLDVLGIKQVLIFSCSITSYFVMLCYSILCYIITCYLVVCQNAIWQHLTDLATLKFKTSIISKVGRNINIA